MSILEQHRDMIRWGIDDCGNDDSDKDDICYCHKLKIERCHFCNPLENEIIKTLNK